jgi:hypothetical protein
MTHFQPYTFNNTKAGDGVRFPIRQVPVKDYLSNGILNPSTASLYRRKQNLGINPYSSTIKAHHISFTTPSEFAQYGRGRKGKHKKHHLKKHKLFA